MKLFDDDEVRQIERNIGERRCETVQLINCSMFTLFPFSVCQLTVSRDNVFLSCLWLQYWYNRVHLHGNNLDQNMRKLIEHLLKIRRPSPPQGRDQSTLCRMISFPFPTSISVVTYIKIQNVFVLNLQQITSKTSNEMNLKATIWGNNSSLSLRR